MFTACDYQTYLFLVPQITVASIKEIYFSLSYSPSSHGYSDIPRVPTTFDIIVPTLPGSLLWFQV